jgi:hypothetical protein
MMVVIARGAMALLRKFYLLPSRAPSYDEAERHACAIFPRSSDGDLKYVSFEASQLGRRTEIV